MPRLVRGIYSVNLSSLEWITRIKRVMTNTEKTRLDGEFFIDPRSEAGINRWLGSCLAKHQFTS